MKTVLLTLFGCMAFAAAAAQQPDARAAQQPDARAAQQPDTGIMKHSRSRKTAAERAAVPDTAGVRKSPLLRLEVSVWDFGDVPRKGGDVWHDFTFRNDGTAPLVVLRVVTSCSCVKASYPRRPVAPGDTGVIRITYEPHKSEPGAFNKVIQILSNSSGGRDILTVQGNSLEGEPRARSRQKAKNR